MAFGAIAAGMIGSSIIGGISASKAANQSAAGYERSAQLQLQAGREARDYQHARYGEAQDYFAPYMEAGEYGIGQYRQEAEAGFGLPEFQQPTEADMLVDPSYQWRLDQGIEATTRALTKSGQAWGGQRGIALMDYAQNAASQEYSNIYNRAVQNYGMQYQRRSDYLDRILGLSEQGRMSAGQLGQIGAGISGNVGNTIMGAAQGAGQGYVGSANAQASGTIGVGRALSGAAEGIGMMYSPYGSAGYGGAMTGGAAGAIRSIY